MEFVFWYCIDLMMKMFLSFSRKDQLGIVVGKSSTVDWLELPDHLVFLIANKGLHRQKDLIRFGAVCKSWRSVYIDVRRHRSPRLPLLMLATDLNQSNLTRSFYSVTDKRVCDSHVPVPHDRVCRASSHGWLVTVTSTFQVSIFNPFLTTENEIHLPPFTAFERDEAFGDDFHHGFFRKAVLSANPALDPNYLLVAIYGNEHLAYFKPGDTVWTCIGSHSPHYFWENLDIILYRDQLYTVNRRGYVFAFDLSDNFCASNIAPPPSKISDYRYLVESSSGDLLHILKYIEWLDQCHDGTGKMDYKTIGFDVFKLDPVERKWIELHNLDGQILFIGNNSSLCLMASDHHECKPDSIYFTDDYFSAYFNQEAYGIGPHDMGVFSFEDRSIRPHYPTTSKMIYPAPIWIEPPPSC